MQKDYQYAVTNGYIGTLADYKEYVYGTYVVICQRNKIVPMSFTRWLSQISE